MGQVIAPLFGSSLEVVIGFPHTTTITAALDIVFAIAYFTCAGGYTAFANTIRNYTKPEAEQIALSPVLSVRDERIMSPFMNLSPTVGRRIKTASPSKFELN